MILSKPRSTETTRSQERGWAGSSVPSQGAWPCQHLGLGLLSSRIVTQKLSAVLSHQFVALCVAALGNMYTELKEGGDEGEESRLMVIRGY